MSEAFTRTADGTRPRRDSESSLEKGLAVLFALATAESPMTMNELAAATGYNRATTYRICTALERAGWLQAVGAGKSRARRVDLGPQTLGFSVLATSKYDPAARLQPIMDQLMRKVNDTVHSGVREGTTVIHVGRVVPENGPHLAMPLGAREDAHLTALGKALLATLSTEEVLRLYRSEDLAVRTSTSLSSREALLANLAEVREAGYSVDAEESSNGVMCVGAPVFGSSGALFALSVTSTPTNLEGGRLRAVAAAVCDAADEATLALGGAIPDTWRPRRQDGADAGEEGRR